MKITQTLLAQHIGRMTKRHWWVQGKRVIRDILPADALDGKGIEIVDAMVAMKPPKINTERYVRLIARSVELKIELCNVEKKKIVLLALSSPHFCPCLSQWMKLIQTGRKNRACSTATNLFSSVG